MPAPPRSDQRRDAGGWIQIRIGGSPHDRGYQHGYLLAHELREALRTIRYLLFQTTGVPFDWLAENAQRMFADRLAAAPDDFGLHILQELEGIAEGANANGGADDPITPQTLLGWNAYPELICQWLPAFLAGRAEGTPLPSGATPHPTRRWHHFLHSCSAFAATGSWTTDGGPVLAHTTWQCFANGDAYNVVVDLTPDVGHRILMQGVPGYVASSTDFWVTGAGLVVTETSINGHGFRADGLPEFFRARRAAQFASSIGAWCDIFREGNNGGYTNSWLLADVNTSEIACFELMLGAEALSGPTADGCLAGFNIPLDPSIRNLHVSQPSGWDNVLASGSRRVRWDWLLDRHRGKIDADAAKSMLADHHDAYKNAEHPSSRSICGHVDNDDGAHGGHAPWYPWGSLDGKVVTAPMVRDMTMDARWGRACGTPLDLQRFLALRPQYVWLDGYMKDRPAQPWLRFPIA